MACRRAAFPGSSSTDCGAGCWCCPDDDGLEVGGWRLEDGGRRTEDGGSASVAVRVPGKGSVVGSVEAFRMIWPRIFGSIVRYTSGQPSLSWAGNCFGI